MWLVEGHDQEVAPDLAMAQVGGGTQPSRPLDNEALAVSLDPLNSSSSPFLSPPDHLHLMKKSW